MILPRDCEPGTFFWLKVPISLCEAERLKRDHVKPRSLGWGHTVMDGNIKCECSSAFTEVPEFEALDVLFQRVEAYDLAGDSPWYSIAVVTCSVPDDDMKMLLLLKYDVRYDYRHAPADGL